MQSWAPRSRSSAPTGRTDSTSSGARITSPGQPRPLRPRALRAETQYLVDLPGRTRAVQRVEVQAGHSLGQQTLAHRGGELDADLAYGRFVFRMRAQFVGEGRRE